MDIVILTVFLHGVCSSRDFAQLCKSNYSSRPLSGIQIMKSLQIMISWRLIDSKSILAEFTLQQNEGSTYEYVELVLQSKINLSSEYDWFYIHVYLKMNTS